VEGELRALKEFFESCAVIPPREWLRAVRFVRLSRLKKGDLFFRQGEFCDKIGFVVRGLGYVFFQDEDGRQGTRRFIVAGMPVSPYPAVVTREPANDSLEALEDMVIVWMTYTAFEELMERHPCWDRIMRKSLEREIMEREVKEYELFMLSASERYERFCRHYHGLVSRVPQYLIASYIGVTPVALSRIRNRRKSNRDRFS
jgi:CRP-like cAMP-binding protein